MRGSGWWLLSCFEKYMNALWATFGAFTSRSPFLSFFPFFSFAFVRVPVSDGDSSSLSRVAGAFLCLLFGSNSVTVAACAPCNGWMSGHIDAMGSRGNRGSLHATELRGESANERHLFVSRSKTCVLTFSGFSLLRSL